MSVTNTKPHDGDFWATPKEVKEALADLIKNKNITAIDPCYGTGGTEIEGVNYIAKYDIIDYGMKDVTLKSFLDVEPYKVDAVIMNPPFSLTTEFIEHARKFSNDIYIIGQWKEPILNHYARYIVDAKSHYSWKRLFGIKTTIAAVHLNFNKSFEFGYKDYKAITKKKLGIFTEYDKYKTLDEMPIYDGTQTNILVFRPNLLATNHDFDIIDSNTGFEYWVTPIFNNTPDEVKQYLTYHTTSGKSYKKGELKNLHYIQYDNKAAVLRAYEKYTSKEFKESIHWNLSIFPKSEIPVFTDFGKLPYTYEEKREFTALKENIGNRITSVYYSKHQGRATNDRDLQIKGVDRVVDGKYVDDKYIFGNYQKFFLEIKNPQFKHSGGVLDDDKLTDYLYWWEILYCRLTIIDYKKLKQWYNEPVVKQMLHCYARQTQGYSSNGTIVVDIPWDVLEESGVIVSRKKLELNDLNFIPHN